MPVKNRFAELQKEIAEWRQAEAEKETQIRRPDMWQRYLARQQLQKG